MAKNRNTKRARIKLKSKFNQKPLRQVDWSLLIELNRDLVQALHYLDTIGRAIGNDYKEKIESDSKANETFKGYYHILGDIIKAVGKINVMHAEKDEDGNPKVNVNGGLIFKKGKCLNETESGLCTSLMFEYQESIMNIEPMIEQVLPDLVAVVGANKETQAAVNTLKGQLRNITSLATQDMVKSVREYEEEVKRVSSETARLMENNPEFAAVIEETVQNQHDQAIIETTDTPTTDSSSGGNNGE